MGLEEDQREKDAICRTIFENSSDAFLLINEQDVIIYFSPSNRLISGYTPDEGVGQFFLSLIHPSFKAKIALLFKEVSDEAPKFTTEFQIVHKNGSFKWVEAIVQRLLEQSIEHKYLITLRDIEDRKKIDLSLSKKVEELQLFFSNSIDMLCVADTNGYFRLINPEWTRTLGYSSEELLGNPFIEFVHPDDVEMTIDATAQLASLTQIESFVNRYRHKNGSYLWIEWRSYPSGGLIYASARDVTQRIETELRMKEVLNLHAVIFENAGYSIIVVDDKGLITNFNRMAEKMLGYKADEVIGKLTINVIHDPDEMIRQAGYLSEKLGEKIQPGFEVFTAEALKGYSQEYEWTYIRKDGTRFPVSLKVTALNDGCGVKKGFMGIAVDITDRKRAEELIIKNEKRLKRAQAIGNFGYSEFSIQDGLTWASAEGMRLYGIGNEAGYVTTALIENCVVDFDMMRQAANDLIHKGKKFDIEYTVNPADGSPQRVLHAIAELELDFNETPISLNITFQDITDQRNVENALRKSELQYRQLFENLPSGFALHEMIYDIDGNYSDFKYVEINPGFEQLTGLKAKNLIGRTAKMAIPNLEDYWVQTFGKVVRTGEPMHYMNYANDLDKYFDSYVFSPQKDRFAVIFNDVTDKVKGEEQLKESEKKFRNLVTNVDVINYEIDKSGKFILSEGKALLKLGLHSGDLVGQYVWDVYKKYPEVLSDIRKCLTGNSIETVSCLENMYFETRLSPLYDKDSNVIGLLGVAIDITDRRLAVEALRESEKMFSNFYNLMPDMVGISRLSDGLIINANPAFSEFTGYEPDDYLDKTTLELGIWKNSDSRQAMVQELIEHGFVSNLEFEMCNKRGETFTCLFSAKPMNYNDEECVLFVVHDISERKNAEQEVLRNEQRLQSIVNIMQFPSNDQKSFLDFALEEALKLTQSPIGYIYYYKEDKQEFVLNSWSKEVMDECAIMNPMTCYALDKTGLWGEAVRQRKPIVLNDFENIHSFKKGYPEGHVKLSRFLTIPVFYNDKIVSVVGVANKPSDYISTDILQLTLLMDAAWKVINNRKADEALRVSEQKYRKLFENMNGGFAFHEMVFDSEGMPADFRYIDANHNFLRYWNLDNDVVGKTVLEVFSFADKWWIDNAWEVIQTGEPYIKTNYISQNDMYVETIEFRVDDTHFAAIFNDVTVRIKAEQALKESEFRYRSIVDNLPIALGVADMQGNVKFQNNTFVKYFGFEKKELTSTAQWFELAYPDPDYRTKSIAQWNEDIAGLITGEASFSVPRAYKICSKNKQELEIEITFTVINNEIYTLFNNITDKTKALNELRISEQKFSDIYSLVPDAIGIIRLSDNIILEANPSYTRLTGYTREEYFEKNTIELGLWAFSEKRDDMMKTFYQNGEVVNQEAEMRIRNGEHLNCLFSLKPIVYREETCVLFVIHDITELKNVANALKVERNFTNSLLDSVPGIVYMYDEKGKLVRWNKRHETMTGYSADELSGKDILSWYGNDDKLVVSQALTKLIVDGFSEIEIPLIVKEGSTRQFYFSAIKTIVDGKDYVTGIGLDITERKLANENLRQLEQRFQNIYNLSPDMIGITRVSDGKILSGNPALTTLTGFLPEDYLGHSTLELNWWANTRDRDTMLTALKEKGEVKNFEIGMRIKSGEVLTCLFSAKSLTYNEEQSLLFIVHDITERVLAEKKLAEERNLLRTMVDTLPINIYIKDCQSRFLMINEPLRGLLGASIDQIIGKNDFDFFVEEKALEFYNDEQALIRTKVPIMNKEEYLEDYLGQEKILSTTKLPLLDNEGLVIGLVGSGLDITAQKQAEQQILNLNATLENKVIERTLQLERANKDLESFAYSVSHDLRAPLRHIDGFMRLLYSNITEPSDTIKGYYDKINAASKRMSTMIDDLLSFSRLGRKALNLSAVDIGLIVHEVIEYLKPDATNREIQWIIHPLPMVNADANLLKNAFENLISNALKYSQKTPLPIIEVGSSSSNNDTYVEIFIKDNGVGFDMAYADKLFGVFQRLHGNDEFEGTGIGLASVKQIITKHKGFIRGEGKVNEGASFFISLPKYLRNDE